MRSGLYEMKGRKGMTYLKERELICRLGQKMWQLGWVAANDGNLSLRLEGNHFLVTPTGVSKGEMTPEMLVVVDSSGEVLEPSCFPPSSETPLHLRCYQDRPDIGGICHAHPVAATAFACARVPLDCNFLAEARMNLGQVPVTPYAPNGTEALCRAVAPYLTGHNALLLANHGALTLGGSLEEAYYRMETLEHTARICLNLPLLGGGVPLSGMEQNPI